MVAVVQNSVAVRNARLDAWEATVGTSPILKIFDGTMPADCDDADAGTVLATITLPSDWMANASGGVKSKSGTWQDSSADNTGTADYYRIYDSTGTTCHEQGNVATSGAALIVDNVNFNAGQSFTITSWDRTAGNA